MKKKEKSKPRWAHRADHIAHKPDWVDFVPRPLWELGQVFFPIPSKKKGWEYPHHMDKYRFKADDEVLNAYFEAGWGYGIACAGDLAVVDVDEKHIVGEATDGLPETLWQVSGSGDGVHLFYFVEGMNTRQILHYKEDDEWKHLGEIKCDPHGYVVGPGSVHPSGGVYGPLRGDSIETISKKELLNLLDDYIKPNTCNKCEIELDHGQRLCPECEEEFLESELSKQEESKHQFYNLTPEDVIPWLEAGKRVPHPVHGSDTGSNFMKMPDEDMFMCWRHNHGGSQGCGLNPQHLLAVKATNRDCDTIRSKWRHDEKLHWYAWRQAVEDDLVSYKSVPYTVIVGYGKDNGLISSKDDLKGDVYWDIMNSIKVKMQEKYLPDEPLSDLP